MSIVGKLAFDNDGNLVALDPDTGEIIPVPFDEIDASAVDHNQTTNRTHEGDQLVPESVDPEKSLSLPVYNDDSSAPTSTQYWHAGEQRQKFKDANGDVFVPQSELWDDTGDALTPAEDGKSVSVGQVATTDVRWTEVSPSRSFDTWYQAPSDRDIEFTLIVEATSSSTQINVNVSVNDEQSANVMGFPEDVIDSGDNIQTAVLTVPAGHYYRADQFGDAADYEINRWFELR